MHLYGNILDRFQTGLFESWSQTAELISRALTSPWSRSLWCYTCESYCLVPCVDVLASGIPCTDWSPAGNREGLLGPTAPVLAAYIREILQTQPALGLFENVPEFNVEILRQHLSVVYEIIELQVNTAHTGFQLVRRERLYVVLVHKSKARLTTNLTLLYDYVSKALMHNLRTQPADALVADDAELQADMLARCAACDVAVSLGTQPRHVLTDAEKGYVLEYERLYWNRFGTRACDDPNLFVFLGDNPANRCTWSAVTCAIPTFRTNTGRFWHPHSQSWLTKTEMLAAMGFPVIPEMARAMHTQVLRVPDQAACRKAVGNCMHFGSVYLVLLCSLASVSLCR